MLAYCHQMQNKTHTLVVSFITNFGNSPVKMPAVPFPTLALACTPYYYERVHDSYPGQHLEIDILLERIGRLLYSLVPLRTRRSTEIQKTLQSMLFPSLG